MSDRAWIGIFLLLLGVAPFYALIVDSEKGRWLVLCVMDLTGYGFFTVFLGLVIVGSILTASAILLLVSLWRK